MVELHKRCKGPCTERKPLSAFSPAGRWPDGSVRWRMSYCRECNNKRPRDVKALRSYTRKWARNRYQTDPEWRGIILERNRKARGAVAASVDIPVPVEPVRVAVEASGVTVSEIARRAELNRSTAAKALRRERMSSRHARAILEAIGLSPLDVGL